MKIKKVAVISKPDSLITVPLKLLLDALEPFNVEIVLDESSAALFGKTACNPGDIANADVAFVLGGDGTILYAASQVFENEVPIVGFHLGRLGFITPFYQQEIPEVVEKVFNGSLKIQKRMRLSCTVIRGGEVVNRLSVLNEFALLKSSLSRIADFDLYIDDILIKNYRADGFIVSSPTGSTGYALSTGGPLVDPSVDLLLLTPVCPHSIDNRELIIGPDKSVKLRVQSGQEDMYIMSDGQLGAKLEPDDVIEIMRSERSTKLYYDPGRTFFNHLKNKFNWGKF